VGAQARWRAIERDATGNALSALEDMPAVPTVKFLEVVNGKHRCKRDAERNQPLGPRGNQPPVAANGSAPP
jgi:hypothetical protein